MNDKLAQKILVVEDSTTQAQMLRLLLEDLGMEIDVAECLTDGLEAVGKNHYDAILLDLILPDSMGLDTLVAVTTTRPWTPVIVLTALTDTDLGFSALKKGAEDFIVKGEVCANDLARALRYAIERKRQSATLFEKEKRLRLMLDNSYDAFIMIDENMEIAEWNNKAEEMFGYSLREAQDKHLLESIFPPASAKFSITDSLRMFLAGQESEILNKRVEIVGRHRGGREFPIEVAFFPVQQGLTTTFCTFVSDITDRKEFEKHAADFYSIVAHEMRSPLTSILGSLAVLDDGIIDFTSTDAVEMVSVGRTSCDRLIRLINDLLDLSKFEAGKMPLDIRNATVNSLVRIAASECKSLAAKRSVQIVEDDVQPYLVRVDQDKIVQVLINLVSNALKFSPENGTVTLSARPAELDKIRFEIKDEGPGLTPEQISSLFQKFHQVETSSESSEKGTGLGLAICQAIVAHHKGDIGIESKPGSGATFWFEVPLAEESKVMRPVKSVPAIDFDENQNKQKLLVLSPGLQEPRRG